MIPVDLESRNLAIIAAGAASDKNNALPPILLAASYTASINSGGISPIGVLV